MLAVIQTIVTSLFAGRPEPFSVTAVPALATSGVVFRVFTFSAGLPGSTSGPARAGVPGIVGAVTAVGSAAATDCRSSTPAAAAQMRASLRLEDERARDVLVMARPFALLRLAGVGDDGHRVVVRAERVRLGLEHDPEGGAAERVVRRDVPRRRPEPDPVRRRPVSAPVQLLVRLAWDLHVGVLHVLGREDVARRGLGAPDAEDELLSALEHVRLRAADRPRSGCRWSRPVDRVDVEEDVE